MSKIECVDLFGGIGGFRHGLSLADQDFTFNYYADIDKFACAVYNYNFHETWKPTDIRTVQADDIPGTEDSVPGTHALPSQEPDSNGGSTTPEDSSFSRLSELSGLSNQNTYSWKTLRDYCQTTEDVPSRKSSIHFGTVGTWDRGAVSTARHSCLNRESESILSDVLETNPAEHFYLSRTAMESLIHHAERHREKRNGFGTTLLTPYSRETVRVVQCNTSSGPIPQHTPVSPQTDQTSDSTDGGSGKTATRCSP